MNENEFFMYIYIPENNIQDYKCILEQFESIINRVWKFD